MAEQSGLPLHLAPASSARQRIWRIGSDAPGHDGLTKEAGYSRSVTELWLRVYPDQHDSFAALRSVLDQLGPYSRTADRDGLNRLERHLEEALPGSAGAEGGGHGRFMTDAVTFAIMRRISRESVYTARVIDLGARVLNEILGSIPGLRTVHLPAVERLDRPSLKVFFRAVLLLERRHRFCWMWHLSSDPFVETDGQDLAEAMFVYSRLMFFRRAKAILGPTIEGRGGAVPMGHPPRSAPRSLFDMGAALVVQNYDACFLWCREIADAGEAARLLGLAAVNTGRADTALLAFSSAIDTSTTPARAAHLCYLRGLVEAKRSYDLSKSDSEYRRGLAILDRSGGEVAFPSFEEDIALERGWILNGLALNDAIRWRRGEGIEHHRRAFDLVREAFGLIRGGDSPGRTYLRFNLVANSAFLMEMIGRYDIALEVLSSTFDDGGEGSPMQQADGRSTMSYRLAVLHHRAGRPEKARDLLREALAQQNEPEAWPIRERIERALGTVEFELGDWEAATATFRSGLESCRAARSADGSREHARGLAASLLRLGQREGAAELIDGLQTTEGLECADQEWRTASISAILPRPAPPPSKLPPYIPEIDLEEIPVVDLNRFLVNLKAGHGVGDSPWKS